MRKIPNKKWLPAPRDATITFRVNDDEKIFFEMLAKDINVPLSQYIRNLLLKELKQKSYSGY